MVDKGIGCDEGESIGSVKHSRSQSSVNATFNKDLTQYIGKKAGKGK